MTQYMHCCYHGMKKGSIQEKDTTKMNAIIYLYIVTISMVSAFALHGWVPVPLLVALSGFFAFLIKVMLSDKPLWFFREDIVLCLFFIAALMSTLLGSVEQKNVNHLLSYFAVFFLYLFTIRSLILCAKPDRKMIYNAIVLSVMLASFFAIIEFLSKNIVPRLPSVDQYIYRKNVQYYSPLYAGKFIRARSFVEESGHFALYLNTLGPIAIYWAAKNYSIVLLLGVIVTVIAAFIITFSAAGIFCLALASFLVCMYSIISSVMVKRSGSKFPLKETLAICLILVVVLILFQWISGSMVPILDKITLQSSQVLKVGGRVFRWKRAIELWKEAPFFGIGPGEISYRYGIGTVSWYLKILSETGLIALILLCCFFLAVYSRLSSLPTGLKTVYFLCLTSGVIHYAVISNYWMPWIWLVILLIQVESSGILDAHEYPEADNTV